MADHEYRAAVAVGFFDLVNGVAHTLRNNCKAFAIWWTPMYVFCASLNELLFGLQSVEFLAFPVAYGHFSKPTDNNGLVG